MTAVARDGGHEYLSRLAGVAVYSPAMHVEDGSRLLLLGDLRRALDATDQLTLHYQPKVRLSDGDQVLKLPQFHNYRF